jgi:type IV pilus assembly protein PilY1
MNKNKCVQLFSCVFLIVYWSAPVYAQLVVNDTLTGAASTYGWKPLGGACLTAGNGTGTIPKCDGLPAYSGKTQVGGDSGRLPDPVGKGALRLTNGEVKNTCTDTDGTCTNGDNGSGSVVSTDTFPTNQGVQVTFSTVTYGGDGYKPGITGAKASGADGIAFFYWMVPKAHRLVRLAVAWVTVAPTLTPQRMALLVDILA